MLRSAYAFVLSIGALLTVATASVAPPARAQITAVAPCPACGYREAAAAYREALERATNPAERAFLSRRLGERWTAVAPKIRERVRAALGDDAITLGRGAYVGIGAA